MRKTLFITAANRPNYFRETMNSWRKVRGFYDWKVVIRLEPTPQVSEHQNVVTELQHENIQIVVNPQVYGVLHHPWVGFNELFMFSDFVVRAEDDLLVSDDILEYFDWASEEYLNDKDIAAVIGFSPDDVVDGPEVVNRRPDFSPWVWGTWHDRWVDYMRDTWDHDYSTYNGSPGNQAGWDWNLDTRILPGLKKQCIMPSVSRVQNIGVFGVHGTPENFVQASSFTPHIDPVSYHERDSSRYER